MLRVLQHTVELIPDKCCRRRLQLSRTVVNGGITFHMQMRCDLAVPSKRRTTLSPDFSKNYAVYENDEMSTLLKILRTAV